MDRLAYGIYGVFGSSIIFRDVPIRRVVGVVESWWLICFLRPGGAPVVGTPHPFSPNELSPDRRQCVVGFLADEPEAAGCSFNSQVDQEQ